MCAAGVECTLLTPCRASLALSVGARQLKAAWEGDADAKSSAFASAPQWSLALTHQELDTAALQLKLTEKLKLGGSETMAVLEVPLKELSWEHVRGKSGVERELRDKKGRVRGSLRLTVEAIGVAPIEDTLRHGSPADTLTALKGLEELARSAAASASAHAQFSAYCTPS